MPPRNKPSAKLRKPPPAQEVDDFVFDTKTSERSSTQTSGGSGPKTSKRSGVKTPKRRSAQASEQSAATAKSRVQRRDGRELRRMTLYMPVDLATRLRVRCSELDREVSAVVTEAVASYLAV